MPHIQLLAYCRYIQLWSLLYVSRIIHISPLSSLMVTSFLHLVTFKNNSKRIGILSLDIIQILFIINNSKKMYIIENLIFFSIYSNYLFLLDKDPISLHLIELKDDDEKYIDEHFINYIKRIYSYILYE